MYLYCNIVEDIYALSKNIGKNLVSDIFKQKQQQNHNRQKFLKTFIIK